MGPKGADTAAPRKIEVTYQVTASLAEGAIAAALETLSPEERARHDRLVADLDRREYAAAHALLRTTLSRLGGRPPDAWAFQTGTGGKPSLVPPDQTVPPLSFSLSHTRGLVACAIAPDIEIGIDVENIDRPIETSAIAGRYFAPAETAQLARVSPEERTARFFELWTLKEAYLKATGAGLSHPLDRAVFELDEGDGIGFTVPGQTARARWQFALFAPTPRHRMAVAASLDAGGPWSIVAASADPAAGVTAAPLRESAG
jgi:4'-phosphopantetheinyl transferase